MNNVTKAIAAANRANTAGLLVRVGEQCNGDHSCLVCIAEEHSEQEGDYAVLIDALETEFPDQ